MKSILLSVALLCTTVFNHSFARNNGQMTYGDEPKTIKTLIVNADVTIVLVNNDRISVESDGSRSFEELLVIKQQGDTVIVDSRKNRDLKSKGIVFIPASQLKYIKINSSAYVRSLATLQIPKLDVVINGACKVSVSNFGTTNLIETDNYAVEETKEIRYWPAKVFLNNSK